MNYLKDGARVVAQSAQPILFDADRGGFFVVEQNAIFGQPGLTAENALIVPAEITRLQLAMGMAAAGLITAAEAESFAGGNALPAAIVAAINAIPADQRPAARIKIAGMSRVERVNPLLSIIMAQATPSVSEAEMDAYFIAWSQIQ